MPYTTERPLAFVPKCSDALKKPFERTLEYLKTREQFGVKIGSFQGLRHRAAHMFGEMEFARSVVRDAQSAIDDARDDLAECASAAKARCSEVAHLIGSEAIQMHGGIGMTDEEEIGLFFKRLKAAELTLGDAALPPRSLRAPARLLSSSQGDPHVIHGSIGRIPAGSKRSGSQKISRPNSASEIARICQVRFLASGSKPSRLGAGSRPGGPPNTEGVALTASMPPS